MHRTAGIPHPHRRIHMSNKKSGCLTAFDVKSVAIPIDPLADAKSWLAAMEISLRRTAQQAQQSTTKPAGASAAAEAVG
jgi:hypothetical protein